MAVCLSLVCFDKICDRPLTLSALTRVCFRSICDYRSLNISCTPLNFPAFRPPALCLPVNTQATAGIKAAIRACLFKPNYITLTAVGEGSPTEDSYPIYFPTRYCSYCTLLFPSPLSISRGVTRNTFHTSPLLGWDIFVHGRSPP